MRTVLLTGALLILGFGFLVSVNGQAQTPGTLPGTAAEPQSLDRTTAAPAMTDIHDIKPLEPVPMGKTWLLYLLAGLAALLLLAVGLWLWHRRHRPREAKSLPPPVPPEVVAREALKQLAADQLIDGQTFYFRLSAILRQYIDQRYNLGASKMTTEEFVPRVETLELNRDLKRPLINLCQGADPIKFAKATVDNHKKNTDLRFVEDFVQQTTPRPHV
jgi:hypothetical protein